MNQSDSVDACWNVSHQPDHTVDTATDTNTLEFFSVA